MIPEGLTIEHFQLAAGEIDSEGVPSHRKSVHYDLLLNGRKYPPKYLISLATRYATGSEYLSENFNAVEAKNYFENKGYKIIDRRAELIKETINRILPEKQLQENCLKVFSDCIVCADESESSKWSLYRYKNKIRLLVGSMIVCTLEGGGIWLPLDKGSLKSNHEFENILNHSLDWKWDKYDYPEYSRVPSINGYYFPKGKSLNLWNTLGELHFSFIRNVAKKFKSLSTKSQAKHEPDLLVFLQDILGRILPSPDHNGVNALSLFEKSESEFDNLTITETERDALTKSRIGQGKFRTRLKIFWKNNCAVTGCSAVDILKASHIKPWHVSDNYERLDEYNGLLLTPNLDVAFDSGLISFDKDGAILISKRLRDEQKTTLGIEEKMCLSCIDNKHQKYLEFHRKNIFKEK